jgi:Sulfatase
MKSSSSNGKATLKSIAGLSGFALTLAASTVSFSLASARVVTGTLGSPGATTTFEGNQLPAPRPKFGGVIKPSALNSTQWWAPRVVPPKGAPNVLLIMTDDQVYGVAGTFGGVIPTPALDHVANAGLRYIQFHSTALCSPTRAALITGRNYHSVGSGVIGELSTGYPGYDSIIGRENASIGTMLKDNNYSTSWFGKDHITPNFQYSVAGPYDRWTRKRTCRMQRPRLPIRKPRQPLTLSKSIPILQGSG